MLLCVLQFFVFATLAALALSKPLSTGPAPLQIEPNFDREQHEEDCNDAIWGLPDDLPRKGLPAIFGRTKGSGNYMLPRWYKIRSCGAFVEFRDGEIKSEVGSWAGVRDVMQDMNNEMYDKGLTNIERFYGERQRIRLIFRYFRPRPALTYQNQSTSVAEDGLAILSESETSKH